MELLTIDNAKSLLEEGKTYRIGTNALNVLEFTYEHKGFKTKNPNFKIDPPFWKGAKSLFLDGVINWLDVEMEEQETNFRFHALKKANTDDKRFTVGAFTAWNGEPLWLLDELETVDEIMLEDLNEEMLPNI